MEQLLSSRDRSNPLGYDVSWKTYAGKARTTARRPPNAMLVSEATALSGRTRGTFRKRAMMARELHPGEIWFKNFLSQIPMRSTFSVDEHTTRVILVASERFSFRTPNGN